MIRSIMTVAIAIGALLFQAVAFAGEPTRPKVWIYTDMSNPTLPGTNHRGTINDPDDVSAMAGYLLMADRFETLGIVVASTHRKEHATTPDQAAWAKRVFGGAYQADLAGLKQSSESYPDEIQFVQSCLKESAEKFVDGKRYDSLASYSTIKSLFDAASQLDDDEIINVLCWGSLTEPAILVAHCLATKNESLLKKLRFIAHWTNSSLHQGTPEHPERVANCQEDAAACRYLKAIAGTGKIVYYECGAIGQHGIVSGSPKGTEYFDPFRTSRLGTLFVEGKYVNNCVDHSDSATYWVLLGEYGVSLQDIAANGTNSPTVEKANETKFAAASKQIHDELLRRSKITGEAANAPTSDLPLQQPRQADGDGSVQVSGEMKQWHKVTLTLDGPYAHELDNDPNPFVNYQLDVTFTHESGSPKYTMPGYFAADGDAANTSAQSGTKWRAHLSPDKAGKWDYQISMKKGQTIVLTDAPQVEAAVGDGVGDGVSGSFMIADSNKTGRDLRAHGRLQYVGERYLKFAGSGEYFLKAGADAPETLLGYADFDGTVAKKPAKVPLKTYAPHIGDWNAGDPSWQDGKGKGLIGAVNYLSSKGCNAFSFLTYNAAGDGDNVWPFVQRDDKLHYDCSKLDQWGMVFDHGTAKGMYLHFKMQETENDDHILGPKGKQVGVPECLDGGNLGMQRRLYCRELIARFGHNLALNWNLGEENTQTTEQQQAMIDFITQQDPYHHNIVLHTFPDQQDKVYRPLLGDKSKLTGLSLQNSGIQDTHWQVVKWVSESLQAGKPWVVAFDESGTAAHGQCPDLGYQGYDGHDRTGKMTYTEHEVRQQTLWGTLMGGGAGVEYYFGYQYAENDLLCEDWRSRDRSWDYCRIAINFFHDHKIPFWEMLSSNTLIGNPQNDNSRYCFAKDKEIYLVYLPNGGSCDLDLSDAPGAYSVHWFNPRAGGELTTSSVTKVESGKSASIGSPPSDADKDWLVVVRRG